MWYNSTAPQISSSKKNLSSHELDPRFPFDTAHNTADAQFEMPFSQFHSPISTPNHSPDHHRVCCCKRAEAAVSSGEDEKGGRDCVQVKGLSNLKEEVYGALDAFIAWS
ncbi:hypothetical protein AKJ16_DCAP15112 [Drosera capensis]